jgi:hypothetical protein
MSWDVVVLNYGGKLTPTEMLEADPVGPLGPAAHVRRRIAKHLPGVDWSDPEWGVYEGDGFTIEFNTGNDPIDSILLHVRGEGDAIAALLRFANPNRWSLLDCSTTEFLAPENPSAEGWEVFQASRLTGAAILVSRASASLQAAPAVLPWRYAGTPPRLRRAGQHLCHATNRS